MPEIKNAFLKSKMNKDLDDRLIPNGEYRDALNLQISRSESSDVGEFETMLGNTSLGNLMLGSAIPFIPGTIIPGDKTYIGQVIGQYTDEANGKIYTFSTSNTGQFTPNNGVTPRDVQVYTNPAFPAIGSEIKLYDVAGVLLDPTTLGLEIGMSLWGDAITNNGAAKPDFDPYITEIVAPTPVPTDGYIKISWDAGASLPSATPFTIGWCNKIHVFDIRAQSLTLLVEGGFLNFSTLNKIYGINLLEDLLFWTDNRNQPRKININLANPDPIPNPIYYTNEDSISVAKYYPYEAPKILEQVLQSTTDAWFITNQPSYLPGVGSEPRGCVLTMNSTVDPNIKIGDIVTGFEARDTTIWTGADAQQEVWKVTTIGPTFPYVNPNGLELNDDQLVVYNQLYELPYNVPAGAPFTYERELTFSRSTQTNQGDPANENYLRTIIKQPAVPSFVIAGEPIKCLYNQADGNNSFPLPQVGDLVTSPTIQAYDSTGAIVNLDSGTITPGSDANVRIAAIKNIPALAPYTLGITLTKDIEILGTANDEINIGNNPDFRTDWGGDPDLLENIFVRFSYRFKFEDNEYSIIAPFTQTCFIPKQLGLFGAGQQSTITDMDDTFKSTIVSWFENRIDSVGLKIPLPLLSGQGKTDQETLDYLRDNYKVKAIDILYKESDATTVKVIETCPVSAITVSDINIIPGPYNAANEDIRYYYNFDYKSSKPTKTLPGDQTTRVYDKVPVKALGQEITGNRITYGNYLEGYTPPKDINYEITVDNRAVINLADETYNNYTQYPSSTLKQNRNYQVGWVLGDKYGRQSSVILSTNDALENTNGSTIYAPYKSYSDVQALTTYEWLGDVMRMKINTGITPTLPNTSTGEPGTQKAYENTTVDSITISAAGTNYPLGITTTTYNNGLTGEGPGLGSGLEVEITTVSGGPPGPISGIKIIKPGNGYVDGQLLRVDGGTNDAIIQVSVNPPNVLGWYSYKFVVKQQEQDYYNVYFPGFSRGYPNPKESIINYDGGAGTLEYGEDAGETSFTVLLSDNIQKVPRNLQEIGPNDKIFNSSVELYGRVNNPDNYNIGPGLAPIWNSDGEPWNCQYYPGRINDTVVQISLIGLNGFEIANSPFNSDAVFGAFNNQYQYDAGGLQVVASPPQLPYGGAGGNAGGKNQAFFGVEKNPLAIEINVGSKENQENLNDAVGPQAAGIYTLGALVTTAAGTGGPNFPMVASMRPFLSVSETAPVVSELPLFWETGDTGDIVALNRRVNDLYGGVITSELGVSFFDEGTAPLTIITPNFNFLDSAGSQITADITVTNYTITNGVGDDVTNRFNLNVLPLGEFNIETAAAEYFWYGLNSFTEDVFTITFNTSWTPSGAPVPITYNDTITGSTLKLTNLAPSITSPDCGGTYPATGSYTPAQEIFYTYEAINGSLPAGGNDTSDIYFKLENTAFTPLVPFTTTDVVFELDSVSGVLKVLSGTLEYGDYTISVRVTDATDSNGVSGTGWLQSALCNIIFTVGYAHAAKAVCAGRDPSEKTPACSESIHYYFGSENYFSSLGAGTTGVFPSTGIEATQFYNVKTVGFNPGGGLGCAIPGNPWPASYSTAEVVPTSGIKITINFEKTLTPVNVNYSTNYTILWRPTPSSPWQGATPIGSGAFVSPTLPGVTIDTLLGEYAAVAGSLPDFITPRVYHFSDAGEYSVICKPITGTGCGGATLNNISFFADWEDLYYPDTGGLYDPCADCIGID